MLLALVSPTLSAGQPYNIIEVETQETEKKKKRETQVAKGKEPSNTVQRQTGQSTRA